MTARPSQLRPYSDDDPLTHGIDRGTLLFQALHGELAIVPSGRTLVDVGCGYGGLALAWARLGGRVVAVDVEADHLRIVKERVSNEAEARRARLLPAIGSALELPVVTGLADYVLMSGVLEWVGFSRVTETARTIQIAALAEARRVLKPGGTLIVATKNRLFPRYCWRDAQVGLPLVNAVPRWAADRLCRWKRGYSYRGYVYSYWGWRKVLRDAGYESITIRIPLMTYQYPAVITGPWDRVSMSDVNERIGALSPALASAAAASRSPAAAFLRGLYYSVLGGAGCLGLGSGSFLLLARKPNAADDRDVS